MEHNAFMAGVNPGGLWNQSDIKILICYVLASVNAPLSRDDIVEVLQDKNLANYFEINDALEALLRLHNVEEQEPGLYTVTETGRKISNALDTTLPLSVRDKALESAVRLMAYARNCRENKVEIEKTEKGFTVTCHISGGEELELMKISLFVADRLQAEMVRENFHQDPDRVYQVMLSALTGDRDLIQTFFGNELRGTPAKNKEEQ